MDRISKKARSVLMSKIKGSGNKTTEAKIRSFLTRNGVSGWKMNDKSIMGAPDFVFHKIKLAIFVDGCFWHKCPKCYREPKTKKKFWRDKIQKNTERDLRVTEELKKTGWKVLRIWEHELKKNPGGVFSDILRAIGLTSHRK